MLQAWIVQTLSKYFRVLFFCGIVACDYSEMCSSLWPQTRHMWLLWNVQFLMTTNTPRVTTLKFAVHYVHKHAKSKIIKYFRNDLKIKANDFILRMMIFRTISRLHYWLQHIFSWYQSCAISVFRDGLVISWLPFVVGIWLGIVDIWWISKFRIKIGSFQFSPRDKTVSCEANNQMQIQMKIYVIESISLNFIWVKFKSAHLWRKSLRRIRYHFQRVRHKLQ